MSKLLNRIARLRTRKTDLQSRAVIFKEAALTNALPTASAQDAMMYLVESSLPVDAKYTKKTYDEAARVEAHIKAGLDAAGHQITFEHQGSVTNDTHIRFYSDIDVLAATERYIGLQLPLTPTSPYLGNPIDDLKQIRTTCTTSLRSGFPAATVDTTKPRCVSISGGSLERKIDVVPCNWLDTTNYRNTRSAVDRGIEVLNVTTSRREENFPFLHNARISAKDARLGGNLRRAIRLAKSIRSDADAPIDISSYDICGLCYAMPDTFLSPISAPIITLLSHFIDYSIYVLKEDAYRNGLKVPNETRLLFGANGMSTSELLKLSTEALEAYNAALGK